MIELQTAEKNKIEKVKLLDLASSVSKNYSLEIKRF